MTTIQTRTEDITHRAEKHIMQLLTTMGLSNVQILCTLRTPDVQEANEKHLHIALEAQELGRLLIGAHGEHLLALQHIVRSVLWCRLQESIHITVDVNSYLAHRERSLQQLAEHSAKKAQQTGRAVVLRPMTAFERRIIHTALGNHSSVRTESLGEEPNRRVIIRPVFL
jgi:spoIIIJ-associated protein